MKMFILNSEQRIERNDANIAYFYIVTNEFSKDKCIDESRMHKVWFQNVPYQAEPKQTHANLRKSMKTQTNSNKPKQIPSNP